VSLVNDRQNYLSGSVDITHIANTAVWQTQWFTWRYKYNYFWWHKHKHAYYSRIWGSCGSEYEDVCLLGWNAVQSGRSLPVFQRYLLPPSSGRPWWWRQQINFYQTTQHYNPQDSHLHAHYRFRTHIFHCRGHLHSVRVYILGWTSCRKLPVKVLKNRR
jgi:hypothetical protein